MAFFIHWPWGEGIIGVPGPGGPPPGGPYNCI